jgi:hypothetical protein
VLRESLNTETETETKSETYPETETRKGGTTVHTTEISPSVAPPSYLNQTGIDAALRYVQGNWPKSAPMTADQREAWLDVLCQLRKDELKAACALRTDNQTYRPDAYPILEIVIGMRSAAKAKASVGTWKPLERVEKSDNSYAEQIVAKGHAALAAGKARRAEEPRWSR